MRELGFKGIRRCLTLDEQKELDQLTLLYPEPPRESELATAIKLKLAELRKKRPPRDPPIIRDDSTHQQNDCRLI